ncbi:hypothetical protein JYU34_006693 [Plutella xylostella]|uniref:Uncharacterized protein n=1 Tax=Plutella xylostella TaxID=51655 RepID=A0ABQ7QSQ1_PLUXY|nr:hypothetical protein JYU34_006693 [Plutella xylostella]
MGTWVLKLNAKFLVYMINVYVVLYDIGTLFCNFCICKLYYRFLQEPRVLNGIGDRVRATTEVSEKSGTYLPIIFSFMIAQCTYLTLNEIGQTRDVWRVWKGHYLHK